MNSELEEIWPSYFPGEDPHSYRAFVMYDDFEVDGVTYWYRDAYGSGIANPAFFSVRTMVTYSGVYRYRPICETCNNEWKLHEPGWLKFDYVMCEHCVNAGSYPYYDKLADPRDPAAVEPEPA